MEERTKHPDVTGGCEAAVVDRLRRHPFDGQDTFGGFVVTRLFDPTTQPEVGQFHTVVRRHQNIPRRNVPVVVYIYIFGNVQSVSTILQNFQK